MVFFLHQVISKSHNTHTYNSFYRVKTHYLASKLGANKSRFISSSTWFCFDSFFHKTGIFVDL